MILAFAHPALVVPDLEAAARFYCDMFGFEPLGEQSWSDAPEIDRAIGLSGSRARGQMLKGHNCFLELFEYQAPESLGPAPASLAAHEQGIRHLAFYVDDCRKEYRRFMRLGGKCLGEPAADEKGNYVVYGRDPFGNIIELCEIPGPEEAPTRLRGIDRLDTFAGDSGGE